MKQKSSLALRFVVWVFVMSLLISSSVLLLWVFAARWPFPNLLPSAYSLRSLAELFAPYKKIVEIVFSNAAFSLTVAIAASIIGMMTSRALAFYDFYGKRYIRAFSFLPILVPSIVLAMGVHLVFIHLSLHDTVFGVFLIHLIYSLPYSVNIMLDSSIAQGLKFEQQASVLGASPIRAFFYATLPNMKNAIVASVSMAYIISFSQYYITLLIGGGRVESLNVIMVPIIAKGDRSLASAHALLFFVSAFLVFALVKKLVHRFIS